MDGENNGKPNLLKFYGFGGNSPYLWKHPNQHDEFSNSPLLKATAFGDEQIYGGRQHVRWMPVGVLSTDSPQQMGQVNWL